MKNKTKRALHAIALGTAIGITMAGFVVGIWFGGIFLGLFLLLGLGSLWDELEKKHWPEYRSHPGS